MNYLMHVGLGFVMAYFSLVPPGMLNMTAVRTAIEKGRESGRWFALGAALVVIPQAFVALVFAKFFADHPEIVEKLNYAGIFVLFGLSVMFFLQARKKFKGEGKKRSGKKLLGGHAHVVHEYGCDTILSGAQFGAGESRDACYRTALHQPFCDWSLSRGLWAFHDLCSVCRCDSKKGPIHCQEYQLYLKCFVSDPWNFDISEDYELIFFKLASNNKTVLNDSCHYPEP